MTVGIIGYGWVGKAMHKLFPEAIIYDVAIPGSSKSLVSNCDISFVCVPTPNTGVTEGALNDSAVDEVVSWCDSSLIVVRSTLQPGTADRLSRKYGKRIVVQPEYLGETPGHPLLDMTSRPFLIIGGHPVDRRQLIDLYTTVYNANVSIRQVTCLEAEIIKLTENRAIAFKVAQCQELYDACISAKIDYYTIRDAVYGDDPRFDLWFSFIFPDNRGMNSKCIPKDVIAWSVWAESVGYTPKITDALLAKNEEWIDGA